MRLWHFTGIPELTPIVRDRELKTTESNIGSPNHEYPPSGEHVGPDVLWTFTNPEPVVGNVAMLTGHIQDHATGEQTPFSKQLVRFSLEVPDTDVVEWLPWAASLGIHDRWLEVLTKRERPDEWRCVLRPVPEREWVEVEWRPTLGDPWRPVLHSGGFLLDPRQLAL